MSITKISNSIFCITTKLSQPNMRFEGIWEIPTGVTINAYVIKGEKNVLIDAGIHMPQASKAFFDDLTAIGLNVKDIDYLVLNHLEPDHGGLVEVLVERNPNIMIYTTQKGADLIRKFFKIEAKLQAVTDNYTLQLGTQKEIKFIETPNVHWPETMMSYYAAENTLFSCDCFGGYGIPAALTDAENTEEQLKNYEKEALRYYANIMPSFNSFVLKALDKVPTDTKIICPSHGIVWTKNPQHIRNLYQRFAGYNTIENLEPEVCIVWGSMYGCTKCGVDAVVKGLTNKGVHYTIMQIPDTAYSYVLADSYKAKALVLAMPTYEYKMFPPMAHILDLFERKHFTGKIVLRIGSWGWIGGAKREYDASIEKMGWENMPSYEWQGIPSEADLENLTHLGEQLADLVNKK